MSELCKAQDAGDSDDLDLWLMLAASEYGLATRDPRLFDQAVPYSAGGRATFWDHLKLAFRHQESLLGPHGGYLAEEVGDWSDLSTSFLQMTESTLVTAQAAYVYPRLALLADARGDRAFAAALRQAAQRDLQTTRAQWTARGWYARGYAGAQQFGSGAIFGEPQPWAILAGAPDATQAAHARGEHPPLPRGRRGGRPGPAGSARPSRPPRDDPERQRAQPPRAPAGSARNAAVFPGGSWYAVDGWLTWALGSLGDSVPHARDYAFSELELGTLAAHARAYPSHWDGITSVDDACHAFYSPTPAACGAGLTTGYAGQVMHQPAWSLFDTIRLAGIEPTATGFRVEPRLPMRSFSLALPRAGVAYDAREARGYFVTATRRPLTLEVKPPAGRRWSVRANGRPARFALRGGMLVFSLPSGPVGERPGRRLPSSAPGSLARRRLPLADLARQQEVLPDALMPGRAEALAQVQVAEQGERRVGSAPTVVDVPHEAGHAVHHLLLQPADAGADHRTALPHRLEHRHAEALAAAVLDDHRGAPLERVDDRGRLLRIVRRHRYEVDALAHRRRRACASGRACPRRRTCASGSSTIADTSGPASTRCASQ